MFVTNVLNALRPSELTLTPCLQRKVEINTFGERLSPTVVAQWEPPGSGLSYAPGRSVWLRTWKDDSSVLEFGRVWADKTQQDLSLADIKQKQKQPFFRLGNHWTSRKGDILRVSALALKVPTSERNLPKRISDEVIFSHSISKVKIQFKGFSSLFYTISSHYGTAHTQQLFLSGGEAEKAAAEQLYQSRPCAGASDFKNPSANHHLLLLMTLFKCFIAFKVCYIILPPDKEPTGVAYL